MPHVLEEVLQHIHNVRGKCHLLLLQQRWPAVNRELQA
jgi:hypothetical protein